MRCAAIATALIFTVSSQVLAWSEAGHKIVASIAFGRLTPDVRNKVVAILRNPEKKDPLFTIEERIEMLREITLGAANVEVESFNGLLVDYAVRRQARVILRGLRAISDYENEMNMALMNRKLDPNLETVFMMPAVAYTFLSSRLVREVVQLGGDVRGLVPPMVEERLRAKV